ncbi:MAG: hypothetical protein KDJ16_12775 [Hyphomicrobiales bacterium]|nr:hypothetical protein [Rhodoblastus sp.]MCC2112901.1 hypothetical protein [Hyphomicrobiales bacterium]
MNQAGTYASAQHWKKALPTEDPLFGKGKITADGLKAALAWRHARCPQLDPANRPMVAVVLQFG